MATGLKTNSFDGNRSIRTLIIYKLNSTGTAPINPVVDLIPGMVGNRITLDVVTSESFSQTYDVTDNALQDFSFATSNISRVPRTLSVTGVMGAIAPASRGVASAGKVFPLVTAFSRAGVNPNKTRDDLIRFQNLQTLADRRQPVAVYTPRHGFPVCAIVSITADWDPETGRNTRLSLSFKEINIASPLTGDFVPDYVAQAPGNNQVVDGGNQTAQPNQTPPAFGDFANGLTFVQ